MKNSSNEATRNITANEVKKWFGSSRKAQLDDPQYEKIAVGINRLRWPCDPAPPEPPLLPSRGSVSDRDYWDFPAVTKAAKTLLDSLPEMATHWRGLLWAPETRGGYDADRKSVV